MKTSTSLFLILLALAIGFFYVKPTYTKINILNQEKEKVEYDLNQALEIKGIKNTLFTKYNNINPESITLLKKVVPEIFDKVRFVGIINDIAIKNNMTLSNVSVDDNSKNINSGRPNVLPIQNNAGINPTENIASTPYITNTSSFILTGNYKDFLVALKDLEKSIEIVDIKGLTVDTSRTSPKMLSFSVTINTYSIK